MITSTLYSGPSRFYRRWGQRKYTPGAKITSVENLCLFARHGVWFFAGDRPCHGSILLNQPVSVISSRIQHGGIKLANRAPEFPYVFKADWMKAERFAKINGVKSQWWITSTEFPSEKVIASTRKGALKACLKAAQRLSGNPEARVEVNFFREESR